MLLRYWQVLQEAFAREIVNVVSAVNAAAKAKVSACNEVRVKSSGYPDLRD